jgi:hypothetical protein
MGSYMVIFEAKVLGVTYFIEGWSKLQHDLNNIQEVLHFEHCVNL